MEEHKGWIRYTENPEKLLTMEEYYSQYIPRIKGRDDHSFTDQAEEMTKDLPKAIHNAIENGIKHINGDFFIEVIIKAERRIEGLYKNIIVVRPTCPSPSYERIVYQYHKNSGDIELLWIIPTLSRCLQYFSQSHLDVKSDDRLIHEFVSQYANGDLDRIEKQKNLKLKPNNVIITDL